MSGKWKEVTLALLRVMTGFLFIPHGAQKLFGALGGQVQPLSSLMGVAGVLEFFGGILIVVGFFTRPVAFVLASEMAVAYWMVHRSQGLLPIENHGELAVLFCFVFLFLSANGGGDFAVDGLLRRRKR